MRLKFTKLLMMACLCTCIIDCHKTLSQEYDYTSSLFVTKSILKKTGNY